MTIALFLHILTGSIALAAGAIALAVTKGGKWHRKSGIVFVIAMLVMSSMGALIAAMSMIRISVVAGLLAFYLVATAMLTVRQPSDATRRRTLEIATMLIGFATSIFGFYFGYLATLSAKNTLDGYPAAIYFVFASIALIGALLDVRNLWLKKASGKHRIARHLWRMCFAMYLATSAFFLGQAKLFPQALQMTWLLAIPVVIVLLTLIYWLVRTLKLRA